MRYIAVMLLVLSSGLWLGGLIALAMFAPAVFKALDPDRTTAGLATSAMFVMFARYQLFLATAALLAAFLAYVVERRGIIMILFALFALGAIGAVMNAMLFVPKMEELRRAGEATGDAFKTMHVQVRWLYTGIMVAVLCGMLMIPAAFGWKRNPIAPSTE
jgi:hypothetical protein